MLNERSLLNATLTIGGGVLAVYCVTQLCKENYIPVLGVGGLLFLLFCFLGLRNTICVFPFLFLSAAGKLNFLPFNLTPVEITSLAVILYFFFAEAAIEHRTLVLGPPLFWASSFVIAGILIYHLLQGGISLRAFGGGSYGSRRSLTVVVILIAYFCCISIKTPSVRFLSWIPLLAVSVLACFSIPYIISTLFPSATPTLYHITSFVNIGAYQDSQGGGADIVREGALGGVGMILQLYILSTFPITTWWRPTRWILILLSLACFWMVLVGGFRSALFVFLSTSALAIWCQISWRILFVIPLAVVLMGILVVGQSEGLLKLPVAVQRSMAFLPGKWDPDVVRSAEASNDFRKNIADIYRREELKKTFWIGNVLSFNQQDVDSLVQTSAIYDREDALWNTRAFIARKEFHVGWVSLIDAVGIIGGAAFVIFGLALVYTTAELTFFPLDRTSPLFPLKIFLLCFALKEFVGYFTLFGDFTINFGNLLIIASMVMITKKSDLAYRRDKGQPEKAHHRQITAIL